MGSIWPIQAAYWVWDFNSSQTFYHNMLTILIAYPFHAHHQLLFFPSTNFKTDPGKLSSCIDLLYGVFNMKERFFFLLKLQY